MKRTPYPGLGVAWSWTAIICRASIAGLSPAELAREQGDDGVRPEGAGCRRRHSGCGRGLRRSCSENPAPLQGKFTRSQKRPPRADGSRRGGKPRPPTQNEATIPYRTRWDRQAANPARTASLSCGATPSAGIGVSGRNRADTRLPDYPARMRQNVGQKALHSSLP